MIIDNFNGEFAFLSNFYPSTFMHYGIVYPTNEHFFQAMKTTDLKEKLAIADAPTPGIAKRLGRTVNLRPDWELIKDDMMRLGLVLKFKKPNLRKKLLATGDAELIEGNTWHDNTWGSCTCEKCGNKGENRLGKMLMDLRDELQEDE